MISVTVPGSKSETNRVFLMAAFAEDEVTIKNYCRCEDSEYMIDGLRELGVEVKEIAKQVATVDSKGGMLRHPSQPIEVGNAGTTTRFLLAASCLLNENVILVGNKHMAKRPNDDLMMALKSLGADIFEHIVAGKYVEFTINGKKFHGGRVEMAGNISSQFVTALMLIAPKTAEGIEIVLTEELLSKPYIDLTVKTLKAFGIDRIKNDYSTIRVEGDQTYRCTEHIIHGDASSASYWFAWSMLNKIPIRLNVVERSGQGDYYFIDVMERMRATYEVEGNHIDFYPPQSMRSYAGDMSSMPDVVPTLAALSATIPGATHINNVGHLRYKECDRLEAIMTNLDTLGAKTEIIKTKNQTDLVIYGTHKALKGKIKTFDDHRIAMAFGILTSKFSDIEIDNRACVGKSYKHFWNDLEMVNKSL